MKLQRIGRLETRALADAALRALKAVEDEYGVKVHYVGGSFMHTNCEVKFEFAIVAPDGAVQTREAAEFELLAMRYGLPTDALGRSVRVGLDVYTITGLNSKAIRMPVLATRRDGKRYKFPVDTIRRALERAVVDAAMAATIPLEGGSK